MALVVTRIEIKGFRNYERLEILPDPHLTVLVGPNAVGKTNVVEAIQLLTATESFRRPQWPELVKWGGQEARASLHAEGDGRVVDIELDVMSTGRRVYRVNGKTKRHVSDVAGAIPCVVFTPDDLRMVKGPAENRRAAIDGVGGQLSPAYARARLDYERIVRHRNALLKDPEPRLDELDAWTERLIAEGAAFSGHRKRLFERIAARASELYATLSGGETLEVEYVASWMRGQDEAGEPEEAMRRALSSRRAEETARRSTLVGPHRDDIVFRIEGREARSYASQGQQRSIALAWKLAEVSVVTDIAGQPPVLLLDDVMSELDESRRHALAAFVGKAAQTFVTTTNLGYFEAGLIERAKVVKLG